MNRYTTTRFCIVLGLALAAAGCGPGKLKVTGKVTNGGTPIVSPTGHVEVKLIPANAGTNYTTYPGVAEKDGSFQILDVPAGKYKVVVQQLDTPMTDALGGRFSEQNTRIVRDIDGSKPLDIDLSKPEG